MDTPTIVQPIVSLTPSEVRRLDKKDAQRMVWQKFGTIGFSEYVKWILEHEPPTDGV